MSNIDLPTLKKLRETTGVSYSLCRKALEEAHNDIKAATALLSQWGVEASEKKQSRETAQGAIFSYIHHNGRVGVLLELQCETDFVARAADFITLGNHLAMQTAFSNPKDVEQLMRETYLRDPQKTVQELVQDHILKIGENIKVGRFSRFEL